MKMSPELRQLFGILLILAGACVAWRHFGLWAVCVLWLIIAGINTAVRAMLEMYIRDVGKANQAKPR